MITRARANTILDDLFRPDNGKTTIYIGLATNEAVPDENGNNFKEPSSANGYKRSKLDVMTSASDGQTQNSDIIFFALSREAGWGTITHFGVFTAQSGGTPYYTGELTTAVQIPAGYIPIFDIGALKIGLDKEVV